MSNDVDSTVPFERPTGRSLVCLSACPSTPTSPSLLGPLLVTGQMRLFYFTFAYFLACFNYCGAVSTFFKLSAFDVHGWALHCVEVSVYVDVD